MTNSEKYYQNLNRIPWLLQAIKEKLRYIDKVAFPVYSYLDIVLSNEFCMVESCWKKTKMVVEVTTGKYRTLLKRGMINPDIIRRNIANYVIRIEILTIDGSRVLSDLYQKRDGYVPPAYQDIQTQQAELLKIVKTLRSNPILDIVKK